MSVLLTNQLPPSSAASTASPRTVPLNVLNPRSTPVVDVIPDGSKITVRIGGRVGDPLGMIEGTVQSGGRLSIDGVTVLPEFRNQGIGTQLYRALLRKGGNPSAVYGIAEMDNLTAWEAGNAVWNVDGSEEAIISSNIVTSQQQGENMILYFLKKKNDDRLWECYKIGYAADGSSKVLSVGDVLFRKMKIKSRTTLTEQDWDTLTLAYLEASVELHQGGAMPQFGLPDRSVVPYPDAVVLIRQHTPLGGEIVKRTRAHIDELIEDVSKELGESCEAAVT